MHGNTAGRARRGERVMREVKNGGRCRREEGEYCWKEVKNEEVGRREDGKKYY
jgi:hypothetical protein